MSEFTFDRHRRLRSSVSMRALVQETHLRATDFIYPIFVIEGEDIRNEVLLCLAFTSFLLIIYWKK